MRPIFVLAALLVASGCGRGPAGEPEAPSQQAGLAGAPADSVEPAAPPAGPEAVSLLGKPLPAPEVADELRARQEELLAAARLELEREPDDPESWIWVGRRTAYLGRYREAIGIYGRAIERFPEDARLYRHRGHRYITTRRLELAIDDLAHAVVLTRGRADEVEPDGLPNERGIPTSTLQGNVWYHLALAHYLSGDFETSLAAWRECLAVAKNPDSLVAASYWLYLTLGRLGLPDEAERVLQPIAPDLDVIENHDYHRLLLSYRRLADAHALWEEASQDPASVAYATVGYGLGAYHLIGGRGEKAREWFERVLESPTWAAFGYIAAEAELARERRETGEGAEP